MTEGLFILTTIFVAYVVYVIIGDSKATKSKTKSAPATVKKPKPAKPRATKPSAPKPSAAKPAAKKTAPASRAASSPKPKAAAVAATAEVKDLRNPKTGEVSSIASNYRFMKRWIKEALVSESLLDSVYKNNDIDDAIDAKIKIALEKLKTLKKYQA